MINLDLVLVLLFYVSNYKEFEKNNQEKILNIASFIAGVIGILSLTLIGFRLLFINLNPILNFPINVFSYTDNLIIRFILGFVIVILSKIITNKI